MGALNPFDVAELALIEMSRLQRWVLVLQATPDNHAQALGDQCAAEVAARESFQLEEAA